MRKQLYRQSLAERLCEIDARITAAELKLDQGSPREKVDAAGEFALLKQRRAALSSRLSKLEQEPETTWGNVKAELERDLEDMNDWLEGFVTSH